MKRNALCDGVHKASQTGGRERLGQPGAGTNMNKQNNKENKTICQLRLVIAIAIFICGILIACTRVHLLSPIGEYISSAISILREVLILYGAIIGIYGFWGPGK